MAIGSANRDEIDRKIRNRDAFKIASMSGYLGSRYLDTGRLDNDLASALKREAAAGNLDYIVYSYGTPIAWVVNGTAVVPNERYSSTTSNHQTIARVALGV